MAYSQHGNNLATRPSVSLSRCDGQRDQNQGYRSRKQQKAEKVQLIPEAPQDEENALALELGWSQKAHLPCLPLIQEERKGERQECKWQNNGPHSISPTPIGEDAAGNFRTYPHSRKERDSGYGREEGTVQQVRRVGDENLLEDLQALGPSGVENLGRGVSVDVVGRSLLDITNSVHDHGEDERLKQTEYSCNLSHGRFDDGYSCQHAL